MTERQKQAKKVRERKINRTHESVRERMKREGDGKGNRGSKTRGEKKKEHFVSLPEADLFTSWLIFRASHCSGMVLENRYQIYWYI